MVLITVQPDTEWVVEPRRISFEVPAEIGRILDNPASTEVDKTAAKAALFGYAYRGIQEAVNAEKLAPFEVLQSGPHSRNPWGLARDESKLTVEEEETRRKVGLPSQYITNLMVRDMENWVIWVMGRRKARLFIKYPDVLTEKDGFEDFEDLPPQLAAEIQPIYEEKG